MTTITLDEVQSFKGQLLRSMYLEAFVHGNATPAQALEVFALARQRYKNNRNRYSYFGGWRFFICLLQIELVRSSGSLSTQ